MESEEDLRFAQEFNARWGYRLLDAAQLEDLAAFHAEVRKAELEQSKALYATLWNSDANLDVREATRHAVQMEDLARRLARALSRSYPGWNALEDEARAAGLFDQLPASAHRPTKVEYTEEAVPKGPSK